jgi:hypothetical protein
MEKWAAIRGSWWDLGRDGLPTPSRGRRGDENEKGRDESRLRKTTQGRLGWLALHARFISALWSPAAEGNGLGPGTMNCLQGEPAWSACHTAPAGRGPYVTGRAPLCRGASPAGALPLVDRGRGPPGGYRASPCGHGRDSFDRLYVFFLVYAFSQLIFISFVFDYEIKVHYSIPSYPRTYIVCLPFFYHVIKFKIRFYSEGKIVIKK